ncbi:hypothetical protein F7018_14855 [Tenacibaculum aiptasiae]|uniref:Lipoprotein n=1 Tax=Tenacibaculum aiptasiae TaxID=426481 RepID=A0A7J5A9M7_9FLAO|nr:hypothetical protein [Tenacibaculum aiptasiae]KAB1154247.1 hypothetical protein F7018_14855 [Tenacibaculum aiptasiae]
MKYITIFFCLFLFLGCKYFKGDNCNNTLPIVGVYKNIYDKEASNLLIIKEGGVFEQIYTKENLIKKNKGKWKFSKESCDIYFKNLKLMHKVSPTYLKYFTENGIYRLNTIRFNEDLRDEFDFYRVE